MDGITDAPMRELQGRVGAFSYAVTEFVRVSAQPLPRRVFARDIPELAAGARTASGLPVQVQLLGGDPDRMAASAQAAVAAGARGIDINFGCPAPTVNRNDGGASLLREPCRIEAIVRAVRLALPESVPVSAKLRLGWDTTEAIDENADAAARGGANWMTIHARTKIQGYRPPVDWHAIGRVRARLAIPVIANGDLWTFDDFRRCEEITGCRHFMIGRGALANPDLTAQVAEALGLPPPQLQLETWADRFAALAHTIAASGHADMRAVQRIKQWASLATSFGEFQRFDRIKKLMTVHEIMDALREDDLGADDPERRHPESESSLPEPPAASVPCALSAGR